MKTLLILRHGAAEHMSLSGDWGRPLTAQGAADAETAGRRIRETFSVPQVIVTSDALRARQTADIVAHSLDFLEKIDARAALYQADTDTLRDVVQALPDEAALALLVGHNPGLEQFASRPLGTACLACLKWDIATWTEAQPHTAKHLHF